MTRNVRCVYQGQVVGSSNCSGLSKPAESQSCVVKVCTQWRTGQWGQVMRRQFCSSNFHILFMCALICSVQEVACMQYRQG